MAFARKTQRHYRAGRLRCGYVARAKPWYIHGLGTFVAMIVLLFSYAALMQDGIQHAVAAFTFGFAFLLLIYGHQLDVIYVHLGDKIKIGAQSYDPGVRIEVEDEDEQRPR